MRKYRTIWMMMLQWGLLWSAIIATSLLWNQHQIKKRAIEHVHHEAVTILNKDLAFRLWATMHGGVYVHPTEATPPNPHLKTPKRDITTTDGDKLTLMNPAYITRQTMELFGDLYGIKGHITSLYLTNPNNKPDEWEQAALERFEQGETMVSDQMEMKDGQYYRMIRVLRMERGCLKCHSDTGIPEGGVRGGVSTLVPMQPALLLAGRAIRASMFGHAGIWLAGMIGIFATSMVSHRSQAKERRADEQLRKQEALYSSLASSSPSGIFQYDLDGNCNYVNSRWTEITGLDFEASKGRKWLNCVHPEDRHKLSSSWYQSIKQRAAFTAEYRIKHTDGRIVWVYDQAAPVFDSSDKITGYVGTLTDITKLKKTEQELKDTAMLMAESQAIARVAGWKSNPGTDMLTWTEQMYQMLDHPLDEPTTHSSGFRYFDPRDLPHVQEMIQLAFNDGVAFKINCRIISASGRRFWADFRCIGRLEGPDGPYLAGIMQDISEHKQVEELLTAAKEQAESTSRAKTELLATISHELRTPLNGVLGGVQLLEMTKLSHEQEDYLQMVKESARSELDLVNDLLDLASLEASGIQLENQPFRPLDSIKTAIERLEPKADERGLQLKIDLPDELQQTVQGDSGKISQIVSSLLVNAIKFTDQGFVSVAASLTPLSSRKLLQIKVSDSGVGIAAEDHKKIFEPFTQADMSSTRRFGGTGLGLSICRKLTEKMGGSIKVESSQGEGSCFTVELPLWPAVVVEDRPDSSPQPLKADGQPFKLLIAEDNEINCKAVAVMLERQGYQVVCAENGKEAFEIWSQGSIDLILMDIQMPVMGGREATELIRQQEREHGSRTPIIALTAHAMAGDRNRLLAAGFDGYVSKPFQFNDLMAEIKRMLQSKVGGVP